MRCLLLPAVAWFASACSSVAPFAETSSWIGTAPGEAADPWLRRTFTLPAPPVRATARVVSLGYHELWVNGAKVGDAVLTPSVSELSKRARWVDYDVTAQLRAGPNAVVLWLSAGWAAFPEFAIARAPLVRAELVITCADGSVLQVPTDAQWRTHKSPSQRVGHWKVWDYGGERIDAGRELPDFALPGLDDREWALAQCAVVDVALSPDRLGGNRCVEELTPVAIEARGANTWRVDFGRSFTGWFRAALTGAPGTVVKIQIAEREADAMNFNQRSELLLPASGHATFTNRFNYASGRWVTLTGCERPTDVRGFLVRSPYARTLQFTCADPLLNRIQATAQWTFECLSLGGMVVDCPHRERCGYGGDAHATMRTALTHFDIAPFYTQWLEDWRDVQEPDGNIPYTAPTRIGGGGPAWSGVCIQLPWDVYVHTGDRQVLADNWPMMQRWLQFLRTKTKDGFLQRYGHPDWGFLGDWVPPGRGQAASERVDERSTMFFNHAYWLLSLRTAARIAAVLGEAATSSALRDEAEQLRARVHQEWFSDGDRYANGEQPYLALALLAGVPPPELRAAVWARFEQQVRQKGHIDAGIHGHRFVIDALTQCDRPDLVALMARQTDFPSWGDMLAQGATTLWEQWDGQESRLHSSFLGIGAWFVEGLAGIRADAEHPGYERVLLRPGIESGVGAASATLQTPRGPIVSDWRVEGGRLHWRIVVPAGARALVRVPGPRGAPVVIDGRTLLPRGEDDRELQFEAGPGEYRIERWCLNPKMLVRVAIGGPSVMRSEGASRNRSRRGTGSKILDPASSRRLRIPAVAALSRLVS